MDNKPDPSRIFEVGFSFWGSKVLLTAVELEVFTKLGGTTMTGEALAEALGLHPRGTWDFLDALVALSFLQKTGGKYQNTPETDLFLDKKKPSYIGGLLEMANHRLYGFWNHLTEALRTGQPQNELKGGGEGLFATLYAEPARLKEFLAAMTGVSRGANVAIANNFPWKNYQNFADIGTAQGDLAVQIALAQPHLSGIGFDLPEVQPIFEEYALQNGLAKRLRFVGGDFFEAPLPKSDVVIFGHILHDWGLDDKKSLLRKAYEAIPDDGAVIVYEAIIDDDRSQNAFGLLMSLNMLIETPDGFDYTGADCISWMKEIGFKETRVEHLVGPDSMVIGFK